MDAAWLRFLPGFVASRLSGRGALQVALANSGWLSLDKVLRIGVGAVLTVWLARYLGPDRYGQLSYAIGFAVIFGAVASLGINNILVRDLVQHPEERTQLLVSAFALKLSGGLTAFLMALATVFLLRPTDAVSHWLVGIVSFSMVFQSAEVVELWFQSQVGSRHVVRWKIAVFAFISVLKVYLILTSSGVMAFAWLFMAEFALTAAVLLWRYDLTLFSGLIHNHWRSRIRQLLRESLPLMASNTAALLYMRMDIIMLREMRGDAAAGLYAAATVISEAGYFLPVVIVASAFPIILKYQREDQASYLFSIRKLYRTLLLLAVTVALPLSLFSGPIIGLLYGESYRGSTWVLFIHLWACLPMFISVISDHYLLAESRQKIILYRSVMGAGMNFLMNLALIPRFGPAGAAAATVLTHLLILFSLGFFKETRAHFRLLATSLGIRSGSVVP